MDKEQINIVELKLLQRVVDRPVDIARLVEVLPHLGSDEELLALDFRVVGQELLDSGSNLILVQVEPGAVEVSVTGLECCNDGPVCLSGLANAGEGAKPEGWHELAVVQFDHWGASHCDCVWYYDVVLI